MYKKMILLFAFVLLILGLGSAYAGNEGRIGTTGGQELLIPTDARGAALGGSAIANAAGIEAMFWNPAGLAYIDEGTQVIFTHIPWIADIDINYVAVATNIEDFGVIGFSYKSVNIGNIEETTEAFPEGTGSIFSPTLAVLGLSYARAMTTNINFGFSVQLINEDIFEVQASGFAFDFGFQYEPRWHGLTMGIVLKNYGPDLTFTGKGFDRPSSVGNRPVSSENAGSELPTSVNIGLAYEFMSNGLNTVTATGNFKGNNQNNDFWQGGLEYGYDDWLFVRGGYNYSTQEGWLYGATVGFGFTRPVGDMNLSIDYTWTETDVFESNQFFSIRAAF